MELFLKEVSLNDKQEIIDMIEEINNSDDIEKFEGLSNFKKVNSENFNDFLDELEKNKNMRLYKPHLVNQSTFLLVDESGHVYGGTNIRHELNDNLLKHGGNIGYLIRPSERRKGYASKMLELTLLKCKLLELEKVLITCREENIGSAKVIEKNGGVYETSLYNEDNGYTYRRYWLKIK